MRRSLARNTVVVALAAGLAAGCQSYNFNPVARCLIQPGSQRVSVSDVSSADVLFVVDDSGSMGGEQTKLAEAFDEFITSLSAYNDRRVQSGLEPFDFHIAVTTTSVFWNMPSNATCASSCGGASNVCCVSGAPLMVAKTCPAGTGCNTGAGYSCKTTCSGYAGEKVCCNAQGTTEKKTVECSSPGEACGNILTNYVFPRKTKTCSTPAQCNDAPYTSCATPATGQPGCGGYYGSACCAAQPCAAGCAEGFSCGNCAGLTNVCCSNSSPSYAQGEPQFVLDCDPGFAVEGTQYPRGNFVGASTNPRVLHFDKELYGAGGKNKQGFTREQLEGFFAANVRVGTCGSGQEQGLQAARVAVAKALSGEQFDVRDSNGNVNMVPRAVHADWPHAGAKLVVVYIGDEDDCSAQEDPFRGVILRGNAGADSCVSETAKEFKVEDVVHDLQALGRPLGGAFVVSTARTTCVDQECTAGLCCDYPCSYQTTGSATCRSTTCGGQGAGTRFLDASRVLRAGGAEVIAASICDPGAIACSVTNDTCPSGSSCVSGCQGESGAYCCTSSGPLAGKLAGEGGFAPILARIAEVVKPPSAVLLPTRPADGEVTRLRLTGPDGETRIVCNGPAPATFATTDEGRAAAFRAARDQGYDWWFTRTREQFTEADKAPSSTSQFVYINHDTNNCEPNPGDSYVADYLGMIPADGCIVDGDCKNALGGCVEGDQCSPGEPKWTCFAGFDENGQCKAATADAKGTCVCGSRSETCPP